MPLTLWQPVSTHASAGDSWTLIGKSSSDSRGVTAPFTWVLMPQAFVCALQESVSPALWKFYNQTPLAFKSNCLRFVSVPLPDPQVGKSIVGPRSFATEQCKKFFSVIVLQFVGRLLRGFMVGPMVTSSQRTCAPCCASQVCCSWGHCPCYRPLLACDPRETCKHSKAGWTQSPVGSLGPGVHRIFLCVLLMSLPP